MANIKFSDPESGMPHNIGSYSAKVSTEVNPTNELLYMYIYTVLLFVSTYMFWITKLLNFAYFYKEELEDIMIECGINTFGYLWPLNSCKGLFLAFLACMSAILCFVY